jgi:hypothetical protein
MRQFLPLPVLLFINLTVIGQRSCPFTEYKERSIQTDPALFGRMQEIESFTRYHLQSKLVTASGQSREIEGQQSERTKADALPVITIPVVVHIIYSSSAQNISDAQIVSQIAVLNRDYGKHNADTSAIPYYYSALAADCGFQFALATLDTNGNNTTGIVRRHTNVQAFDINDYIKSTSEGGDDAWDRDRYLNIWVGNLTGGVLGYSSVVGGAAATDGVVVLYTAFGTTGTAGAPFNLGRTATHEIGHWLNLIHTWGDAFCGDDEVSDTPPQQQATTGDPSGDIISCNNAPYGNLYMDYMDFTDDIGMHMFTYGQRDRMRAIFDAGGPRYPLLTSAAAMGISLNTTTDTVSISTAGITQGMNVYPNPATSGATVTLSDGACLGSLLDVYNQSGQKVMSERITSLTLRLDVSPLPRGLYFIRVNDGKLHDAARLIKM